LKTQAWTVRHVDPDEWRVLELTHPGWRRSVENVDAMAHLDELNMEKAIFVQQLIDTSVYLWWAGR
jgi:hypothetical protein